MIGSIQFNWESTYSRFLHNDAQYGYDSDNECGLFLDDVSGEYDYDDNKDLIDSTVGECRGVNETTDEAGKIVLCSDSEI